MQNNPLAAARPHIKVARPHFVRAALLALLAITGLVVASTVGQLHDETFQGVVTDEATVRDKAFVFGGAALLFLAGLGAVRSLGSGVKKLAPEGETEGRAASLAFVISLIGYGIILLTTLGIFEVNLQGLLLGGALTGVVFGIAAQQTLGNFFAGIVLLAVRPFTIGEYVYMKSGALGGEYEGTVEDMSLFYVDLLTANGPVKLPNAGVLAAAIGPGCKKPADEATEEDANESEKNPGPQHGGTA